MAVGQDAPRAPDPDSGVFRWTRHYAARHFRSVVVGGLLLPVVAAVIGALVGSAAVAAVIGFGVVLLVVCGYSFLLAPFQQRNLLRQQKADLAARAGTL